jgi:hypothetical protein
LFVVCGVLSKDCGYAFVVFGCEVEVRLYCVVRGVDVLRVGVDVNVDVDMDVDVGIVGVLALLMH